MARIADEVIERVKRDISLLRLVENWGLSLKKHGKDYIGHCPFHDDKTPSFVVSPESNLWNCLGACGKGGSVIDWVMKTQGVSFRHAVELLRDDVSSLAAENPIKQNTVPKLETPVTTDADDQAMLRQVIDYYHQTLKQEPEAQEYLAKRGLDDADLINCFKLGYANRTLGLRLPQKNRKVGKAMRDQLQRIGLYRDTGREHFNGSLVIPVMDGNGVISEVYGRKLLDTLRKGTPKHTYLPGPHEGVFNVAGLANTEETILCESLIDALTFWRWGFRHVTTSYGINGFTDDIQQAFVAYKIKRVLIAYDRDEAGNKATVALAEKLNKQGIDCFRVLFPKGMDANEYACQMSPPQKSLALVIRKAEWIGSGKAPKLTTVADNVEVREVLPALAAKEKISRSSDVAETAINTASNERTEEKKLNEKATPVPVLPASGVTVQQGDNELFITLGDRLYRVRGLDKNSSADQMKIQLLVKRDETFHMDKLDLYSSKQRQVFINQASVELGLKDEIIKKDLGKVLLTLEEQQAKQQGDSADKKPAELEPEDRKAAFELLHDTDLLNRILNDFNQAGVVGEETNKLAGYLSCVSRKLDRPLAVIIQSSSAAGKSSLMESILALMPEEERVQYSAMTGQSLFYMGETNLKNKILAISEEEGASNASYALKLLQSEGEVTIASTGKDDATGNLVTKEYKVEGPVMLFLTTTAIDIDEELLNRCVVLTVNESREQTQAIHAVQRSRRTLQGLENKLEKERVVQLHRNAQRLLKPLAVINPYADQLTFLDDKTRTRRDHEKYLTLIDSIALLHQYQREVKTIQHNGSNIDYVEVTLGDIETANRLAHDILGRTLDELPPQTRKLLKQIQTLVQGNCKTQGIEQRDFRFSRKSIRDFTQWSDGQLKIHCKRLEDMEYLLVHRGGRGHSIEYELLYTGDIDTDKAQMMGLLDVEQLRKQRYDEQKSGQKPQKTAPSQGQVRPKSDPEKSLQATPAMVYSESSQSCHKNALEAV
jgi:DNA primase catalytic core